MPKREEFRSEEDWKSWQKDCRAELKQKKAQEVVEKTELKHDASLVGRVIVIPAELVNLRMKKVDFAQYL